MACYKSSSAAGTPLALKLFVSGRGRLENEGSTALSEVFKVSLVSIQSLSVLLDGKTEVLSRLVYASNDTCYSRYFIEVS